MLRAASSLFLIAVSLLYGITGTLNMALGMYDLNNDVNGNDDVLVSCTEL